MANTIGFVFDGRPIKIYNVETKEIIGRYPTIRAYSNHIGVPQSTITNRLNRKSVFLDPKTGNKVTLRPDITINS